MDGAGVNVAGVFGHDGGPIEVSPVATKVSLASEMAKICCAWRHKTCPRL